MKKSIIILIFLTGSLLGCNKQEHIASVPGSTSAPNPTQIPTQIPIPTPTPTPIDKTTRAFHGSALKTLIDLWDIRKNLESNIGFYNTVISPTELPEHPWIELTRESFIHAMERIKGYPINGFWKYKKFIDNIIPDDLRSVTYQVSNTNAGNDFVNDLNACGLHSIRIGTTFQSTIAEEFEVINPCVTAAYRAAWVNYNGEGGNDDVASLNTDFGNDSPFIFRGPIEGNLVLHPLAGQPMTPRTPQETVYIADLQTRIAEKYQQYMTTNSVDNPMCIGKPILGTFPNTTCSYVSKAVNTRIDRGYHTSINFDGTQFKAIMPFQKNIVDSVFNAIEMSNEADFISATVKLAASHPIQSQRKVVLESFADLFVTKDFSTYQVFSSYMHFLLNCTQFN
jgi:hypothetical protein